VLIGIIKISSQATCNSFPKIFGGSEGWSSLHHIDVFSDYLAMVGDTGDDSLTGLLSS